jgi:hypothetical protein
MLWQLENTLLAEFGCCKKPKIIAKIDDVRNPQASITSEFGWRKEPSIIAEFWMV